MSYVFWFKEWFPNIFFITGTPINLVIGVKELSNMNIKINLKSRNYVFSGHLETNNNIF